MNWQSYLDAHRETVREIAVYLLETVNVEPFVQSNQLCVRIGKKNVVISYNDIFMFFKQNNIYVREGMYNEKHAVIIDRPVKPVFSIHADLNGSSFNDVAILIATNKYEEISHLLGNRVTMEEIINNSIKKVSGKTLEELNRKTRKREIVQARQIRMVLLNSLAGISLTVTGEICGGKDHATVLHARKTFVNLYETDKDYREKVKEVFKDIEIAYPGSLEKLLKMLDIKINV